MCHYLATKEGYSQTVSHILWQVKWFRETTSMSDLCNKKLSELCLKIHSAYMNQQASCGLFVSIGKVIWQQLWCNLTHKAPEKSKGIFFFVLSFSLRDVPWSRNETTHTHTKKSIKLTSNLCLCSHMVLPVRKQAVISEAAGLDGVDSGGVVSSTLS